jgi:hypothetical protein
MGLAASAVALALASAAPPASPEPRQVVSREEILAAMRESRGFDPTATTNGARLQAEVILRLARERMARDPNGPPLRMGHEEWYEATLERTGLPRGKAPAFIQLGYDFHQDLEADYRRDRVIERVVEGPAPVLALNVRIGWNAGKDVADSYSYEDLLSSPKLKVTNKSLITYRLLDLGDSIAFDEIEGLEGRPTSGVLGVLFRMIGEGHVVESRMTISPDGLQVSRARARKALFSVTTTVTVYPDGRTEKDLPADREDLKPVGARLERPLRIAYRPFPRAP